MKENAAEISASSSKPEQDSSSTATLRQLFNAVDRDRPETRACVTISRCLHLTGALPGRRSGTISAGEMATAFQRIRGRAADSRQVLQVLVLRQRFEDRVCRERRCRAEAWPGL